MDLKEYINGQIAYFETQEKAWTHEMIETLKVILNELQPRASKTTPARTTDEAKALQYLKDLKIKGAHFYKGEKLIAKAIDEGFIL